MTDWTELNWNKITNKLQNIGYIPHFVYYILMIYLTSTLCSSLFPTLKFGERNGNPLQYSCLENPMVREAWQATVQSMGVTRFGWLSSYITTTTLKLPLPSPYWLTTSFFSISVSLLLFCSLFYCIFCITSVNDTVQYVTFFAWLIPPNIMPSKSIHIAANGNISFVFMAK